MVVNWQIAERLQCSNDEKKELLALVDYVVLQAEKARREGLLALEDDIEQCRYPLLQLGLQLVVDGTDPSIIDGILAASMLSSNKRGKEFLEQIISYTAALGIQQGNNPRIIEVQCFAFFGDDAAACREKYAEEVLDPRDRENVNAFKDSDGIFAKRFPEIDNLENFDDRAIQKILREIDTKELTSFFHGCNRAVKSKILQNMSKRAATLIATAAIRTKPNLDALNTNAEKIFTVIRKLEEAGEIVTP